MSPFSGLFIPGHLLDFKRGEFVNDRDRVEKRRREAAQSPGSQKTRTRRELQTCLNRWSALPSVAGPKASVQGGPFCHQLTWSPTCPLCLPAGHRGYIPFY